MKSFIIKFVTISLLFLLPACYYRYFVIPALSGDLGRLGMIPFGDEYDGLDVSWYQRDSSLFADVINITDQDSIKYYSIVTIGDSFSQFKNNGYQYELSAKLMTPVANFKRPASLDVPDCYMALLNSGYLIPGQTVIVESVERNLIQRFSGVDTLKRYKDEITASPVVGNIKKKPFLNNYFSWIRLKLNYKNPIISFRLSKNCFSHKRYSNTLHVYNIPSGEGDLLWKDLSEDSFEKAGYNMKRMIRISKEKGIHLIILIATDKYDAYCPWILGDHPENPTLDRIPRDPQIFDSRPVLRNAIGAGIRDVYKLNNTHWSTVGADIVGGAIFESMIHNNL